MSIKTNYKGYKVGQKVIRLTDDKYEGVKADTEVEIIKFPYCSITTSEHKELYFVLAKTEDGTLTRGYINEFKKI
jgi:hypothetical protein